MASTDSVFPARQRISILAGLVIAALLANGFTAAWLMRLAYLPTDHWWQTLAANLSPLAPFLGMVPFGTAALGALLLLLERGGSARAWTSAILVLIVLLGVGSIPLGWRMKPGESIRLAGLERIMLSAQPVIDAIERYHAVTGEY